MAEAKKESSSWYPKVSGGTAQKVQIISEGALHITIKHFNFSTSFLQECFVQIEISMWL